MSIETLLRSFSEGGFSSDPVPYPAELAFRSKVEDEKRQQRAEAEQARLDALLLDTKSVEDVPTDLIVRWCELKGLLGVQDPETRAWCPPTSTWELAHVEEERILVLVDEAERDAEAPEETERRRRELERNPLDVKSFRSAAGWERSRRGYFGGRRLPGNLSGRTHMQVNDAIIPEIFWEHETSIGFEYANGFPRGAEAEREWRAQGWREIMRDPANEYTTRIEKLRRIKSWAVEAGNGPKKLQKIRAAYVEAKLKLSRLRRQTRELRADAAVSASYQYELDQHLARICELEKTCESERAKLSALGVDPGQVR